MKRIAAVRRSVRCLSSAVLTVQCAACPAARHSSSRDACHGHCAGEYSAPAGAGLFPPAGGEGTGKFRSPGAGDFLDAEKVTKDALETKVSRLPFFAGDFMKPMVAVRRSVRCLSSAVLTVQCAACPAARHFFMLKCLLRTLCEKTHEAAMRSNPRRAFLGTMLAAGIGKF